MKANFVNSDFENELNLGRRCGPITRCGRSLSDTRESRGSVLRLEIQRFNFAQHRLVMLCCTALMSCHGSADCLASRFMTDCILMLSLLAR